MATMTIAVVAIAFIRPAAAQQPASDPFAKLTRLDCTFTASAAGGWTDGAPHAEVTRVPRLEFRIEALDPDASSARVTLGAASTVVTARAAGRNLHVIDRPSESSMAVTTVFGESGRKFRAVHTRSDFHAYNGPGFVAVPEVEQLYGYCTAVPDDSGMKSEPSP
jgi:hypothetical protein